MDLSLFYTAVVVDEPGQQSMPDDQKENAKDTIDLTQTDSEEVGADFIACQTNTDWSQEARLTEKSRGKKRAYSFSSDEEGYGQSVRIARKGDHCLLTSYDSSGAGGTEGKGARWGFQIEKT